jgi:hypothetical protein
MRRSFLLALVVAISAVGCTKDWTDRDLAPVSVNLGNGGTFTVSMPGGLKRTTPDGPLGIYESENNDGPTLFLVASSYSSDNADSYIAGSKDGSAFEKRDVPDGFGVAYETNGPSVHVVRKIGAKFFTCDGSFPGGTKDRAKRLDLIWRICASMK